MHPDPCMLCENVGPLDTPGSPQDAYGWLGWALVVKGTMVTYFVRFCTVCSRAISTGGASWIPTADLELLDRSTRGQNPNKCSNIFVTVLDIFELCSSAVECSPKNSSDSSLGHCPMSKSEEFLGEHPLVGEILT